MPAAFRLREDGIDMFVRLTPKSAADRIDGVETAADGKAHFKARVRAAPEDGRANAALVRLAAEALGIPASAVSVSAGAAARLKTLRLRGDRQELAARIAQLAGGVLPSRSCGAGKRRASDR